MSFSSTGCMKNVLLGKLSAISLNDKRTTMLMPENILRKITRFVIGDFHLRFILQDDKFTTCFYFRRKNIRNQYLSTNRQETNSEYGSRAPKAKQICMILIFSLKLQKRIEKITVHNLHISRLKIADWKSSVKRNSDLRLYMM